MRPEYGWLGAFLAGLVGGAVACGFGIILLLYKLNLIAEFQTLATGILAIVAAAIALGGALGSASMQAKAMYADRERQIVFENEKRREEMDRQALAFAVALKAETETFARQIELTSHRISRAIAKRAPGDAAYLLKLFPAELFSIYLTQWHHFSVLPQSLAKGIYKFSAGAKGFGSTLEAVAQELERPPAKRKGEEESEINYDISLLRRAEELAEEMKAAAEELVEFLADYLKQHGVHQ